MSTYTIELSEYEGKKGSSNGEWYNQFNSKIVIENGDMIQIKQALINTQSSSVENINISEDTVISLTFGIYDQCVSGSTTADVKMLPNNMQTGDNDPYNYRKEIFASNLPNYIESRGIATNIDESNYNTIWIGMIGPNPPISYLTQRATITIEITIDKGVYDPLQIADIISKGMQSQQITSQSIIGANTMYYCLKSYYPTISQKELPTIEDNQYIYRYEYANEKIYIAGASPSLEYINQRFQFTYMHTPVLLNANGSSGSAPYTEIGVSVYQVQPAPKNMYFSRYNGLYLIDLTVQSGMSNFWDVLGFTQSDIFANDSCSNVNDCTTDAYINFGDVQDKDYSLPLEHLDFTNSWNYFISSDISTSIQGATNYQYDDTGYYLINVISSFNNNYINQTENLSKVCCVCSKQYQAGDFITAYSESSIPYQHSGSPLMLSNFQVQIIEPKSKLIANDLGSNSTIFLELIKQVQSSVLPPPTKDDDKDKK